MLLPNVKFEGFWPGFDEQDNFLTRLIRHTQTEDVFRNLSFLCQSVFVPDKGELVQISNLTKHYVKRLFGVEVSAKERFKDEFLTKSSKKIVWYTGENVRPPLGVNVSLSFDQDLFSGTNIYFPLIYDTLLTSLLRDTDPIFGNRIESEYLFSTRECRKIPELSATTFVNNATAFRVLATQEFQKVLDLTIFGRMSGKILNRKSEIKDRFKFAICFENDSYPGYITEKLLHAYALGSVPVYWGNLGRESHLNRKSFIQADDFDSLADLSLFLKSMTADVYESIYNEPLFLSCPDYRGVIDQILERCLL